MTQIVATEGHLLFRKLIRECFKYNDYDFKKDCELALLIWYDDLRRKDFFGKMKPWQVVNRLPSVNVICRKAPFVRLCQRTAITFPSQFRFLPKSYILPVNRDLLVSDREKSNKRYIVKPDRGSLGNGITFLEPGDEVPVTEDLTVVQEYIPSLHINDYKFDCRIYALIASVDPLKIYVYRNGVARFCSRKKGDTSVFSQLTNKSLNKKNPEAVITQIVQMVKDVFNELAANGHNIDKLWKRIDSAIISTVISSIGFLRNGVKSKCPDIGFPRCFQILGFDVLLDEALNPYILEVNYRPSFETNTKVERIMKTLMIAGAMKIMAPSNKVQEYVISHYSEELERNWEDLLNNDPLLIEGVKETNDPNRSIPEDYCLVYPNNDEKKMKIWNRMIKYVMRMPIEYTTKHVLPRSLKNHSSSQNLRGSTIIPETRRLATPKLSDSAIIKTPRPGGNKGHTQLVDDIPQSPLKRKQSI